VAGHRGTGGHPGAHQTGNSREIPDAALVLLGFSNSSPSWTSPKERYDLSIAHSRTAKLVTDLLYAYAPAVQKAALAVGKVFVENDHEPAMRVGSGRATGASRARRAALAMASTETAPLHSSTIVSHAKPRACASPIFRPPQR